MRPSIRILSLVATFAAAVAHGGEAEINLQSWDGQSELPGGWTQTKLKKSSTYANGAQFSGAEYTLTSPQFIGTIQTVSVRLTCSVANPARILKLIPIHPDGKDGASQDFDEPETTGSYEWQVRDVESCGTDQFRIGLSSGNAGYWYVLSVKVTYDEENPVAHPDPVDPEPVEEHCIISNCWKVSEFEKAGGGKFVREADFSFAEKVKVKTPWANGVSVDSFYAFDAGCPSTNILHATSKSSVHGLYAATTNDEEKTVGILALLPSRDEKMELLLPIALDAERKVGQLTIEFRGWEPKVGTAQETTLAFDWCAADSLDSIEFADWIAVSDGDYSGGGIGPRRTVRIPGRDFRGKKFVGLRWSVKKQANSSMLGLSDLRVTADLDQAGFALLIR